MWLNICDLTCAKYMLLKIHDSIYMWLNIYVTQFIWLNICDSIYVIQYMWLDVCKVYVTHLICAAYMLLLRHSKYPTWHVWLHMCNVYVTRMSNISRALYTFVQRICYSCDMCNVYVTPTTPNIGLDMCHAYVTLVWVAYKEPYIHSCNVNIFDWTHVTWHLWLFVCNVYVTPMSHI